MSISYWISNYDQSAPFTAERIWGSVIVMVLAFMFTVFLFALPAIGQAIATKRKTMHRNRINVTRKQWTAADYAALAYEDVDNYEDDVF